MNRSNEIYQTQLLLAIRENNFKILHNRTILITGSTRINRFFFD